MTLLGDRGRDPFLLSIVDGFDENVQKVIKLAVDNGAQDRGGLIPEVRDTRRYYAQKGW